MRRKQVNALIRWTVFCFLVLACVALRANALPGSKGGCIPGFPLDPGWQGADAAYSIPLPDGRDVWIFGDTLYGEKRALHDGQPAMVRNSIGISSCDSHGKATLEHILRRDPDGKAKDFFKAQHPNTWYWAMDGFFHDNSLWITLLCVRDSPKSSSLAMGFETCGTDLAKVSGLGSDAQKWKVEYFPLVDDGTRAYPSAATVIQGEYAYIFALYEAATRPALLTRIPLKGLNEPRRNLEYLAADGTWKNGFDPQKAKPVMETASAEMSVRWHPDLEKWIAILMDPTGFSDKVLLREAPSLTGPWSDGEVIYRVPELQASSPVYDKDTFCYAAKEHPEFEDSGSLVFTYVCNTMDVKKLVSETWLYFPKSVQMPWPKH
ncbi:MAG: DUF4185 domain-containing protein [Terracidiphilus sp.]